jgi:hypothetical protein
VVSDPGKGILRVFDLVFDGKHDAQVVVLVGNLSGFFYKRRDPSVQGPGRDCEELDGDVAGHRDRGQLARLRVTSAGFDRLDGWGADAALVDLGRKGFGAGETSQDAGRFHAASEFDWVHVGHLA